MSNEEKLKEHLACIDRRAGYSRKGKSIIKQFVTLHYKLEEWQKSKCKQRVDLLHINQWVERIDKIVKQTNKEVKE